jgi:NTE family protein
MLAICIISWSNTAVIAQNKRPKIGLVLSGGGAKGIAHIGVLKAMEEAGLTPDYITGTSMGSIVGGLYASGYSADELKEIVEQANWTELLGNKVPFNEIVYEEKPYSSRYLFDFYIENKKLQLPKGIIEGQKLMKFFSNLTRHIHDIQDFNKLPIPFACIASDIVTGQPVVLNKGSLALSMRASMSIPSVFTPVRIDNHLLVDGGLVRNMPVTDVLEMGADIVIGVFVTTDLEPEENLTSAISIISQAAFIGTAAETRDQLKKCNILIQPNIEGISTGSFNMAKEILKRGEEAGNSYLNIFKSLADSIKQLGPMHTIKRPELVDEYEFDKIEVVGTAGEKKDFIVSKLAQKDKKITLEQLNKRLDIIYGTNYFEKVWFEIHSIDGNKILKIYATEHPRIQSRFAYHFDSENKGGIVGNLTLRNILLKGSRTILEADLATFPRVTFDYLKYIGRQQNLAIEGTGIFTKNEMPAYDSLGNLNSIFSSVYNSGGVRLQTANFQNGAFGAEVVWSSLTLKPKVVDNSLRWISKIDYNNTTLSFFHRFDNTNDRYFPTKGIRSEVKFSSTYRTSGSITLGDTLTLGSESLDGLIYTSTINTLDASIFSLIPLSKRLSIISKARLKLSNLPSNTFNLTNYDFIGGFSSSLINSQEYYGVGQKEFLLANYFYARTGLQYKFGNNLFLQANANWLTSDKVVTWLYPDADIGKLGDRYSRWSYSALLGISSPIGPIAFAVGKDHFRDSWKTSLIIGFYY